MVDILEIENCKSLVDRILAQQFSRLLFWQLTAFQKEPDLLLTAKKYAYDCDIFFIPHLVRLSHTANIFL